MGAGEAGWQAPRGPGQVAGVPHDSVLFVSSQDWVQGGPAQGLMPP